MLKNQKGISIVEVLMALLISTIVTTAVITLFSNSLNTSRQLMSTAKLDQTLNSAMETITRDVERAGYYSAATTNATNNTTNTTDPFFATADDIAVTNSTCVVFSYQTDPVSTDTTPVSANRFGYQLNISGGIGAIQYRTASSSCGAGTGWINLTDPNIINISTFTLTLSQTDISPNISANTNITNTISRRTLTITITGNLVSDSAVTRTVTRTIVIDNGKYTFY